MPTLVSGARKALFVAAIAAALVPVQSGFAQKKPAPEFTRQGLLITNFAPGPGADQRMGRRFADAVRDRVKKLVNDREVDVVSGTIIRDRMTRASYNADATYSISEIHALGQLVRADEYLNATVSSVRGGYRLTSALILMRDERLRQPLPEVTATKLEDAADILAKHISAARAQFVHQRRCENALRDFNGTRALAAAQQGVAAYSRSTVARVCLAWAMRATAAPYEDVLSVVRQVLAIDSGSFHAIETAAIELDSLRRREEAAEMWYRLVAIDTLNLDVALRAIGAMVENGNTKRAEPLVLKLSDAYPDNMSLVQQKWRVTYETRNWLRAVEAGEVLMKRDSLARADSVFWWRLAASYKSASRPFNAIEILARGITTFPKDSRLYSLYTQYVKLEADTAIGRGLELFPSSAELLAINAKELRLHGKLEESLDASRRAISLDSTMAQGQLMVAQLEIELGRPDSALASLHRALAGGEDSSRVAQFALAKGNAQYRAANGTHASTDFGLALRFLSFADTVQSSVQSRFLVGATALGLAQAALTEAPKLTDKVESCRLARLGADMIPVARTGLQAGQEAYGDAAKQSLDYLVLLDPYVAQQLNAYCIPPRPY